jgi:curved DNA-binding protein CbpA
MDPHAVLGVSRSADTAEVKTAFKKLAMQWHPDR